MRHIFEDQIDGAIWTFSVENIKGKRDVTTEFRVPLSAEVMKVILSFLFLIVLSFQRMAK
ncbi:hypothetical protein BHOIPH791_08700 [Bartonella henselae]|uniref:hypothetical protein n=1 Tax=Bartonella henselae TaxID=38323 RepID=UPI0002E28F53|nr:hypothetical protein [Bartonella henselae]ATP12502.1 hypothetical protein BhenCHDE101_05045 [Bartonella henselae]MDM9983097.1 hypothetical protein [Bartonella henselae]MDM9984542.1 hypothetical protein [Bartonella henselae]MDM9986416.1 hypothetical protein [Bartonella henselae]MDM9987758.1 hypothetical protein [Bartonella henselae]